MDQNSLLTWGLANSQPGAIKELGAELQAGKRTDLTSAMLAHIMGKSNADRMVECMQVIQGKWVEQDSGVDRGHEVTLEDKLTAWDDLEMVNRGRMLRRSGAETDAIASNDTAHRRPGQRQWCARRFRLPRWDPFANPWSQLDLKFLKLWTPIIAALSDEVDDIRMRACWVCGTAVQVSSPFASPDRSRQLMAFPSTTFLPSLPAFDRAP